MSAQALWIVGPGRAELRPAALPADLHPEQVRVRTLYTGISRGTERLVLAGKVPVAEYHRMRAPHQEGEFPYPVKYGYCNVGVVVASGSLAEGTLVFCLYPHQSEFVVHRSAVVELPAGLPAHRATLAANMETALNAVWDAGPVAGDRVSVVGAGTVGCLTASLLCRSLALDVELVDIDAKRSSIAAALGCSFRVPSDASENRDIVLHTTATREGLELSLDLLRSEGSVIELSWYGDLQPTVALGGVFHSRRLQLRSSQVGQVSPRKPGWDYRQRMELALQLLRDDALETLLNPGVPFAELERHYEQICSSPAMTRGTAPGYYVDFGGYPNAASAS